MQEIKYINIKDKNIPIIVRSFKTSKYLKMYFKANVLYISKPKYVGNKKVMEFITQNEEFIYDKYIKIDYYTIKKIFIRIDEEKKILHLSYPSTLDSKNRKMYIDKGIKRLLKNNTEQVLNEKVPYWSKITNIEYNQFKVNDATSKFGSCVPSTKSMYFSSRLVMLPESKIDAIVVHELCHIIYANHSQDFYNLVKRYIPNYDDINRWLKNNGKLIMF